ncbi:MAG: hypothetical protein QM724_04955 [Flavobacteriales bacterium]
MEGRVKEQKWPGTVMAIGIFVSLFTVLWLGRRTFIPALDLVRVMALCCVVGTLVPYAISGLRLGMEKLEWFLFNVLAIGPLCVSFLLVVNHYVHGPVQWTEGHIGRILHLAVGEERELHILQPDFFGFTDAEEQEALDGRFRVGVAKGCFGYWSVTDVEVVR